MLTSAIVENFRGIEQLQVKGLGRVNLIIGRNDSGKTALMEALALGAAPEDAGLTLVARQAARHIGADVRDFEDFWQPIFGGLDATRGFGVEVSDASGSPVRLKMRKVRKASLAINPTASGHSPSVLQPWELRCDISWHREDETAKRAFRIITFTGHDLEIPPLTMPGEAPVWIASSPSITPDAIRVLSRLKQQGRDRLVTDLVHLINKRVSGIELLAPSGTRVMVFVRLEQDGLLPLSMMGEGAKRTFEFAVALASEERSTLFIDEVENGLHHSTLESLWKWIAEVSLLRNTQVFATTHSEECVQAACRAFTQRENDDGLRVIRLDKQERETRAVVYDRNLVEAAARMGVEIRG